MTTPLSIIHPFPETREQVRQYIRLATEDALEGHGDLMMIYRRLRAVGEAIEGILDGISPYVLEEAQKYTARGEFQAAGATFQIAQRTTYNYKSSGWQKYLDAVETVKQCETFLKALRVPVADPSTGELIEPPEVKSKEYITLKSY